MAKNILRLTEKSASVKISDILETVTLSTDLKKSNEDLSGTPSVSIYRVYSTGNFEIVRNGVTILKSTSGQMLDLDFSQFECIESSQSTYDLVVTPGTGVQVYILLRKETGYISQIQPEVFGQYDNTSSISA